MFLDLFKIRFPVTAIVSICHRVSGVLMMFSVPIALFFIHVSLVDQMHFDSMMSILNVWYFKLLAYLLLLPWLFHILSGLRHIVMDLGFMEELKCARATAYSLFVIFFISIIVLGIFIWI